MRTFKFLCIGMTVLMANLVLTSPSAADVLIVGHNKPFPQIKDAVNAAKDGDTILVYARLITYDGFTIDGKELCILAFEGYPIKAEGIVIKNLDPDQNVVICGLDVGGWYPAVEMIDNQGLIRMENCDLYGEDAANPSVDAGDAVKIGNCSGVTFLEGSIFGGNGAKDGFAEPGGDALVVTSGNVALYDIAVWAGRGGRGADGTPNGSPGGPGGCGCRIEEGTLFVAGSLWGGDGGHGGDGIGSGGIGGDGGDGGIGLYVSGPQVTVNTFDNCWYGGDGGKGGNGLGSNGQDGSDGLDIEVVSGATVNIIPCDHSHQFETYYVYQEYDFCNMMFIGKPGEHYGLLISCEPGYFYMPHWKGMLLIDPGAPFNFAYLGVIPSLGAVHPKFQIPYMGGGFEALTVYLQPLYDDGAGITTLGQGRSLTIVSDKY